ncbi:glycoside hydrolase [Pectobacterium phage Nobby_B4]|uniref:Lysozyme n=7 Tax=Phimunavirus TaxID=2560202 RepID=A0A3G8FJ02_9CAUD|nr:glycoside hydrolase family 24 [Pectobacterium phage Gaspode]YP_009812135.1 glycoside hydrolase family 24 [Pectobacterium phage Nobby]YP_009817329.1 glycoside hydrolase [Pectobacterium phage Zenivior]AXY82094.1 glycoside hydrolase family 24 [Pectobacterium phage Slant]AZF94745.1 glycoside hydrolase [Pectobacterium phage Nobby_B1]AZF94798.1 glycoside hydrolase [Pectobacterium phage Nobby_B2]AZF94873.1 glycoside hydrolase [Pectobacterium phage Nobby_B4]AXY81716.1 glycoside hydrolase family 2
MSLKNKIIGALFGVTALGGGITAVVKHNEGLSQTAYKDSAGVWTICYGETKGVRKDLYATQKQCDAQLIQSITEHAKALGGLPESLPDVVVLGSIDMAYNVGIWGFSSSQVKRRLMAGDFKGAAAAVLSWRYIHKKSSVSPGLGWVLVKGTKNKWQFDCSQLLQGKRNRVCWGLWERRVWQSKAIGNEFKSVQQAVQALPK